MLIEFSVENFRSIRFRQTLSMVAASRLKKKENAIAAPVTGERFPALLKAVAIYGPNASGKSSVFKAMELLKWMVLAKPSAEDRRLPASSFRFDPELRDEPSRFEVHFVEAGVRYAFEMALSAERIHEERLSIYVKGVEHELYARKYLAGHDTYTFGEMLEGGSALHEAWRQLTGPQVLFLSQAVANSNEEINQLRKPFMWLSNDLMFESHGMRDSARYTWLAERHDLRAVLINPAVVAPLSLEAYVGVQDNLYTGERFEFTRGHIDELRAIEVPTITRPERFWLLVETGDEVLDYRHAVDKYAAARQTVLEGGDHGFSRWNDYLDEVLAYAGLGDTRP